MIQKSILFEFHITLFKKIYSARSLFVPVTASAVLDPGHNFAIVSRCSLPLRAHPVLLSAVCHGHRPHRRQYVPPRPLPLPLVGGASGGGSGHLGLRLERDQFVVGDHHGRRSVVGSLPPRDGVGDSPGVVEDL